MGRNKRPSIWSPELTNAVLEHWRARKSGGLIAKDLHLTRNQVMGKLARLGAIRMKRRQMPHQTLPAFRPVFRRRRDEVVPLRPAPLPMPSDASLRSFNTVSGPSYALADLHSNDCRWPIGDPREEGFCYCAAPVWADGAVYCVHHQLLSRVRTKPL
jgi:GcrA cell cycle regulator